MAAATADRKDTPAGPGQDGAPPAVAFALPFPLATPRQAEARPGRGAPQAVDEAAGKARQAMPGIDAVAPASTGPRETAAGPRAGNEGALATPTLPVGWATVLPRSADAGVVQQAELKAPVGSHEFAPALGSQLSVMVRNGVEHAQLKLNPAEMGPIEVRISLDGTQAQVDFSAANAATRQALQEAVPALASALRESGLTLSGGGVFEQAREQRGDPRQDGARPRGDSPGGAPALAAGAAPAARATRARGVVDLYA
jgi:flagellar hook-length control protein FliK